MKIVTTFLFIALSFIGCIDDAPRDNPLDPLSPSFMKEGALSGMVVIANQTIPVTGAMVMALGDKISVTTDSSGKFNFGKLTSGTQLFLCTKQNYSNDTFQVTIQPGVTQTVIRGLNGAPIVTFQQILTRKIDQYFPSPQYFVDITATVSDPNGVADLDSVWFGVVGFKYPMTYSVATKNFHATIYKYDFPTNTIQWLVGKPLTIISKDVHNAFNISTPFYVTRVIENEATPISPSPFLKDTVTQDSLIFKWTPPDVTFDYTYTLTLSRVDGGTQTVRWFLENIISNNEQLPYSGDPSLLTQGNYLWTLTVVDVFGNYARSKESSFVVR